jgi:hypothetical protein
MSASVRNPQHIAEKAVAAQTHREARGCDMHRAGTWAGLESVISAVRIENFLHGSTDE